MNIKKKKLYSCVLQKLLLNRMKCMNCNCHNGPDIKSFMKPFSLISLPNSWHKSAFKCRSMNKNKEIIKILFPSVHPNIQTHHFHLEWTGGHVTVCIMSGKVGMCEGYHDTFATCLYIHRSGKKTTSEEQRNVFEVILVLKNDTIWSKTIDS